MFRRLSLVKRYAGSASSLIIRKLTFTSRPLLAKQSVRTLQRPLLLAWTRTFAAGSTDGHEIPKEILELSSEKYQHESDSLLENLLDELEDLSDRYPEKILDIEYTQGVMTLHIKDTGTYVINKQPPNKQIWLSSPISGPNRFDFYQENWISLRDGSRLLEILNQELNSVLPEEQGNVMLR